MNFFWGKKQGWWPKRIPWKSRKQDYCLSLHSASHFKTSLEMGIACKSLGSSLLTRNPKSGWAWIAVTRLEPLQKAHMGKFVQCSWETQHHCHLHQLTLLAKILLSSLLSWPAGAGGSQSQCLAGGELRRASPHPSASPPAQQPQLSPVICAKEYCLTSWQRKPSCWLKETCNIWGKDIKSA